MWKLTSKAEGLQPLPGVPMRDLTDEEMRDFEKWYRDFNHFEEKRPLQDSGLWNHVEDKASSEKKEG